MVRKANIIQKQELGGGKGCAEVHEIVPEKDLYGHGKLYAKVVLKPNSSVGWHRHVGETEPYYILEGEGIFVDDDGSRTKVGPGDVCTILPGQCHAMMETLMLSSIMINIITAPNLLSLIIFVCSSPL